MLGTCEICGQYDCTKKVCEEIVADDTGDTDELTQYLAKVVLANLGI